MADAGPTLREYSAAELFSDKAVHLVGLVGALLAVPSLIACAVMWRGDGVSVAAVTIYGLCLIAMLGCSLIYNHSPFPHWHGILKRLDHSAIYLKIAGTYTPLIALTGSSATMLLTGLWAAALGGTSLKVLAPDRLRWVGLTLYLGMGWAGVVWGGGVMDALHPATYALVVVAGLTYTAGVAFFLWESLPFHNTIWHGFVVVASIAIFAAVAMEVARVA